MNNKLVENLADPNIDKAPTRNGFGEALTNLGETISNLMVLCADLTESTRVEGFAKKYPQRYIQTGVAEQNMMGIATGLALSDKIPVVASYAVFNPGRNWDQLRVSVCYTNANVKIVGAHAGISVGPDGATHQALEDIAITRCLPNLVVIVPCDAIEARKATEQMIKHIGPVYIRLGREKTPVFTMEETDFQIGKAQIFAQGTDVTIIACGPQVFDGLRAAQELAKESISCEVINCSTIKPLDENTIINSAKKTKLVITLEEHQINGGLGGAIAELLSEKAPTKIRRLGMQDCFGESGQPEELLKKYQMDLTALIMTIKEEIATRKVQNES